MCKVVSCGNLSERHGGEGGGGAVTKGLNARQHVQESNHLCLYDDDDQCEILPPTKTHEQSRLSFPGLITKDIKWQCKCTSMY